jgi:hypothetical protein
MKLTKNIGFLLLGIWLVVSGLVAFIDMPIPSLGIILSGLAIAAGVMILLSK